MQRRLEALQARDQQGQGTPPRQQTQPHGALSTRNSRRTSSCNTPTTAAHDEAAEGGAASGEPSPSSSLSLSVLTSSPPPPLPYSDWLPLHHEIDVTAPAVAAATAPGTDPRSVAPAGLIEGGGSTGGAVRMVPEDGGGGSSPLSIISTTPPHVPFSAWRAQLEAPAWDEAGLQAAAGPSTPCSQPASLQSEPCAGQEAGPVGVQVPPAPHAEQEPGWSGGLHGASQSPSSPSLPGMPMTWGSSRAAAHGVLSDADVGLAHAGLQAPGSESLQAYGSGTIVLSPIRAASPATATATANQLYNYLDPAEIHMSLMPLLQPPPALGPDPFAATHTNPLFAEGCDDVMDPGGPGSAMQPVSAGGDAGLGVDALPGGIPSPPSSPSSGSPYVMRGTESLPGSMLGISSDPGPFAHSPPSSVSSGHGSPSMQDLGSGPAVPSSTSPTSSGHGSPSMQDLGGPAVPSPTSPTSSGHGSPSMQDMGSGPTVPSPNSPTSSGHGSPSMRDLAAAPLSDEEEGNDSASSPLLPHDGSGGAGLAGSGAGLGSGPLHQVPPQPLLVLSQGSESLGSGPGSISVPHAVTPPATSWPPAPPSPPVALKWTWEEEAAEASIPHHSTPATTPGPPILVTGVVPHPPDSTSSTDFRTPCAAAGSAGPSHPAEATGFYTCNINTHGSSAHEEQQQRAPVGIPFQGFSTGLTPIRPAAVASLTSIRTPQLQLTAATACVMVEVLMNSGGGMMQPLTAGQLFASADSGSSSWGGGSPPDFLTEVRGWRAWESVGGRGTRI